ncbi:flagellar motor protein MotB [Sulfurospirillum cavolei]|uniref:flagellar motor protein MotB n=1 Tax=Sulfurospirillum cavolei TaxID=366522 RepID=UPI0005A88408|nr:flagellar motor protein MotB [Sulfurospirillum cavolei]
MGKKCKKVECEAGEKWAVPFSDFFSLLLALFIALFAIASTNTEKMKALKEEFVKIYDYSAKPEEANPVIRLNAKAGDAAKDKDKGNAGGVSTQLDEIAKLAEMIEKMNIGEGSLEQKIDGAMLKLPTKMLFAPGSADITNSDSMLFLKRVSDIISMLPKNVDVVVKGYTDNTLVPSSSKFQDNLELSSARANAVIRVLIKNGIARDRLSSAGYGDTKPVASNDTQEGREKNGRVEFTMRISGPDNSAKKESILDTLNSINKKAE